MRKLTFVLPLALALFSCTKEKSAEPDGTGGGGSGAKLEGTYDFIGAEIRTEGIQSATVGGESIKSVTRSHYFTRDNTGTYVFEAGKMSSYNVSYSIDTVIYNWMYVNNVLDSQDEVPFKFSISPVQGSSPYKVVGTDSLYVSNGVMDLPDGGASVPTEAMGSKFSWSGDTLVLRFAFSLAKTDVQGGIPVTMQQAAATITKLKKRK